MVIDTDGPADYAATRFVTYGAGDAVYGECHGSGGSAGRFTVQDNGAQAVIIDRRNGMPGIVMSDDTGFPGSDIGQGYTYFTTIRTSGELLNFAHRTSNFAGNVLFLDMAQATFGGSFTGKFIECLKGGVIQFAADANGNIYLGPSQIQIVTGAGDPGGSVAAPVGSLYLRTSGGAGTTLYVKESGGSGGGGWVSK